jgi:Flp pilus assembly protein TadD/TolB-like protein
MTLAAGTHLGPYEILSPLGAGGMGEVYEAQDERLKRVVAIKVLPEAFAGDPARVRSLEREAQMLAAVNHSSIATVHGFEEAAGVHYIVMELVPGLTLAEVLLEGPIPMTEALALAGQIAEGLSVAHESGVLHRDLKPSNIKVTPNGRVKILDLGLAKLAEACSFDAGAADAPTVTAGQSASGHMFGTPSFMSPEQARGWETDRRTDIWAFGCVLFEMLSGRRAFPGKTIPDIVVAVLERDPDWTALPAETPPRVSELLRRCLEKNPNNRLRDAGDIHLEIQRVIQEGDRTQRKPQVLASALQRRWRPITAIVAFAFLVGAWVLLRSSGQARLSIPDRKQLAVLPFKGLTLERGGSSSGVSTLSLMGVGLAEALSKRLEGLPGVQLVKPEEIIREAQREPGDLAAARAVGANLVVTGSLRREDGSLQVDYFLGDAHDRSHALPPTHSFVIPMSDLLASLDKLADSVARGLGYAGAARHTAIPPGLDPNEQAQYLTALGLLHQEEPSSLEKALQLLRALAKERPKSALVQAALARVYLSLYWFTPDRAHIDQALAAANEALDLDPGLVDVEITIGQSLLAAERPEDSLKVFRGALVSNPNDVEALRGFAQASHTVGDDGEAEAALRKALELQPFSVKASNQLGALLFEKGRYQEAVEAFRRVTVFAPESFYAFNNLAGALTMNCALSEAMEAFRKARKLAPNDPTALSNLGMTELWTGRSKEAVATLELAVKSAPADFMIEGNLGDAYGLVGDTTKSQEAYGRAVALARTQLVVNPKDVTALCSVATGLAKTGHAAEAVEEMRRALALMANDPAVLSEAAVVNALAGRDAEALDGLRQAVAAGYCREIIARQPEFARFAGDPTFQAIVTTPARALGS